LRKLGYIVILDDLKVQFLLTLAKCAHPNHVGPVTAVGKLDGHAVIERSLVRTRIGQ
jgi:hypothetical protein